MVESDARTVSSLKQDLIGDRAVKDGLNFKEILDKDLNVCWIYPCFNGKLCGVEQFIPLISDDWRLFRLKTLDFVHHSSVKETGLDLWHKRFGHLSNDSVLQTVGHSHETNNIPRSRPGLFQEEQIARITLLGNINAKMRQQHKYKRPSN